MGCEATFIFSKSSLKYEACGPLWGCGIGWRLKLYSCFLFISKHESQVDFFFFFQNDY